MRIKLIQKKVDQAKKQNIAGAWDGEKSFTYQKGGGRKMQGSGKSWVGTEDWRGNFRAEKRKGGGGGGGGGGKRGRWGGKTA